MSLRMQRCAIYLLNETSGPAFSSTDLEHVFGTNSGNELGELMRGGRHHKQ